MFTDTQLLAEIPKLRKFAQKLVRNQSECEDLVQSTMLRALEKKTYFETDTKLFSWTAKIMFNLFVTEYRRRVKYETQFDPEAQLSTLCVAPDQETKVEFGRVQEAMDLLSHEHKEILILICVKGVSYQEAADILEVPIGTVRSRLSRARAEMAGTMEYLALRQAEGKANRKAIH